MRRRRPPVQATARPSDSRWVEDWIEATEPVRVLTGHVPRWRSDPLPGEPPEAVPWRLLAEDRAEAAWTAWERSQPRVPLGDPRDVEVVATRAELPPEARPQPVAPERLIVPLFQGGVRCRWRDIEAFLSKIP